MAYKSGNRMQHNLLPPTIDDYVGPQDPVRAYDAMIEAMDLKAIGIKREAKPGAYEYDPKTMLKLLLYGYSYGTKSSRKLERACYHNLSFQWLMGGLKPDYSTIARFRDNHKEAIKKALSQCVHICIQLNLIEGNILFIDGSKFRANASINKSYTKEQAQKAIKKIEKSIDKIIESSINIDQEENKQKSLVKLKEDIQEKAHLINKMKNVLSQLEQTPEKTSINTTDPDAVRAKSRQGTHACYNVQSTVDGTHGLIVNTDAISQHDDSNQLHSQVEQSTEILGQPPKDVVADARYSSVKDLKNIDSKINIVVPSLKQAQEDKGKHPIKEFDKRHFVYDKNSDSYICPEGQALTFRSLNQGNRTYQAKGVVCRNCRHFGNSQRDHCTHAKHGRRIIRLADEEFKEQIEANYLKTENQQKYKRRKEMVEHPFGHMKRNLGIGQFMLRGRSKVNAESALMAMCFNVARMITIVGGVKNLITQLSTR